MQEDVDLAFEGSIEIVRGRIDEWADRMLLFWADKGALEGEAARERLPEVVCVALDADGEIAGVNSVYPEKVALVGRPFWMYRAFLTGTAANAAPEMLNAAFGTLAEEFEGAGEGPLGLCVPVFDREEMKQRPEPVWPDTELMFAGYTPDGTQIRIRYFPDAQVGAGLPNSPSFIELAERDWSLEERYRSEPFDAADEAGAEEIIALWRREGAMPDEEARRRVSEVIAVVRERGEGVVAVSSAFLRHNDQLRMDLWYGRVFVASAHRGLGMSVAIARGGREALTDRFASGEDTRAPGMLFEVESEVLMRYYNRALWPPNPFTFIGENERGHHVRVFYFPGARVPLPS